MRQSPNPRWLVTEPVVYVMPKPDATQTAKDKVASIAKGMFVSGSEVMLNGIRWLKTTHDGKDAFCLIDGKAVGVARNFLFPVTEDAWLRRKVFKVLSSQHAVIRSKPCCDKGASLGSKKEGDEVVVLEARHDDWVQLDPSEVDKLSRKIALNQNGFMPMNGSALGFAREPFLADTGSMAAFPAAAYADGNIIPQVAPWIEDMLAGAYPGSGRLDHSRLAFPSKAHQTEATLASTSEACCRRHTRRAE